jgi:hypothetical protein
LRSHDWSSLEALGALERRRGQLHPTQLGHLFRVTGVGDRLAEPVLLHFRQARHHRRSFQHRGRNGGIGEVREREVERVGLTCHAPPNLLTAES